MVNIFLISKREYKSFFSSPVAYAISIVTLLVLGIIFYDNIVASQYLNSSNSQGYTPNVQLVVGPLITLYLFCIPALTMRLFPEEQRSGTLELMLTTPLNDWEIAIGKWMGAFLFLLTITFFSFFLVIILNLLISPGIDWGLVFSSYLGAILLAASFSSLGMAVSSLFSNQITAFFATLGVLLAFWLIGSPAQSLGGLGGQILMYMDVRSHFYPTFFTGLLKLSDIFYFLSLTSFGIFTGSLFIESKRWH